jgi:murein DD-endopeptidase MepM/ murein hydrolase activator NlpD
VDAAAPHGTPIVAPLAGVVRHTSQGAAFGPHQFFIVPDADPRAGIFFAHTLDRPAHGRRVAEGERIARVGALGNATGPHLHLEWWPQHARGWGCGNNIDPVPILTRLQGAAPGGDDDMTPEQATQLAEVHWMLGQVRGTDLPPIQRSTGARLLGPVDETRWLTSNSVINALQDIMRRLARIEEQTGLQPSAVPVLALEAPDGAVPGE